MDTLLTVLGIIGIVALAWLGFVAYSFIWLKRETGGDRYFARTLAERRALKQEILRRSRTVVGILAPAARLLRPRPPSGHYRGVAFPKLVCPQSVFEASTRYVPEKRDIFLSAQVKCGTTWMQQIVYELLMRSHGDLGDDGHRHMYALSPWIEAAASVPFERAALIGERQQRIVKTHHNATLCPYSKDARYLYVTRHPVSCFASFVDFLRKVSGPMAWTLPEFVDMYCSDEMYWTPWPDHVEGWWRWAQERPNVLFLHYEDMLDNLPGAVDQVAAFLETPLTPEERAEVVRRSGYDYMKANEEVFEMSAPSYFSVLGGSYFKSGKKTRHRDVGPAERDRIHAFVRERLVGKSYPLGRFYPDVAGP